MKILVHLHLYYQHMLDEMLMYLKNLEDYDYDLYVTLTDHSSALNKKILKFNKNAIIILVKNKGFDVAPFLKVLHSVNLKKYDYIIKMHTKNDMKRYAVLNKRYFIYKGSYWRNILLDFISSQSNLYYAISLLQQKEVGMISHYKIILNERNLMNDERAEKIIQSIDLPLKKRYFVAGTMFICKAELMIPLKKISHTEIDFEAYENSFTRKGKFDGTLAHAYERVFGWIICSQNYKILPLFKPSVAERLNNFVLNKTFLLIRKTGQCLNKYVVRSFKKDKNQ